MGALQGACALRSTANDLLTFTAATMGLANTPLHAAMDSMLPVREKTAQPGLEQANSWFWSASNGTRLAWKNGATGGFFTYIGFDPATRTGIVVLANALTADPPGDIALHILTGSALRALPTAPQAVAVDQKILATYVATYQLLGASTEVSLKDGKLFVQRAGGPGSELVPLGPDEFNVQLSGAHLTFDIGSDGHVTGFVLHQGGNNVPAKRTDTP